MRKIFLLVLMALFFSTASYATERYVAQDNQYNITGYVTFKDDSAYMEVEDPAGNASCFVGKVVYQFEPVVATSFAKRVSLQFETSGDELWVTPLDPTSDLTCGKGPVKFDRIVFKKEAK